MLYGSSKEPKVKLLLRTSLITHKWVKTTNGHLYRVPLQFDLGTDRNQNLLTSEGVSPLFDDKDRRGEIARKSMNSVALVSDVQCYGIRTGRRRRQKQKPTAPLPRTEVNTDDRIKRLRY